MLLLDCLPRGAYEPSHFLLPHRNILAKRYRFKEAQVGWPSELHDAGSQRAQLNPHHWNFESIRDPFCVTDEC